MRVGLIDVDGHNYPNLALMKLSAWHKAKGDLVEWHWSQPTYDWVYMSKVFSDAYTKDLPDPANATEVIRGGSGYAISTVEGIEVYDKDKDPSLPEEIRGMMPDYSLYPLLTKDTAYGRLTEGCPKKCGWCHVCQMQGCEAHQVAELTDFWIGQKNIDLLDPNLLACSTRERLLEQLVSSKATVNFNQGLDIQRTDQDVITLLNRMKIKAFHFAWDDPTVDLTEQFALVGERLRIKRVASRMVYVLTNYGASTLENALERIYILRSLRFDPYVMIYDKPHAPEEIKHLQRWCNNKIIFGAQPDFEKYQPGRRYKEETA